MSDWQINLVCCTDVILRSIEARATQKQVATLYAMAMKSEFEKSDTLDWPTINRAIIERWSMSGLERVKKMAHDHFRRPKVSTPERRRRENEP
jgi:hypothetical protein